MSSTSDSDDSDNFTADTPACMNCVHCKLPESVQYDGDGKQIELEFLVWCNLPKNVVTGKLIRMTCHDVRSDPMLCWRRGRWFQPSPKPVPLSHT